MRKEQDLNVPNVHDHTIDARRRANNGSGKLHRVFDNAQPPTATKDAWWRKYFHWEKNLTVAGRTIEKGWVVPQSLGVALIVVMLSGVGGLYWKIIDKQAAQDKTFSEKFDRQNEMLIRLDQRLIDKNSHDNEKFEQLEKRFQNTDAMQMALNRDLVKLQAKRGTQ